MLGPGLRGGPTGGTALGAWTCRWAVDREAGVPPSAASASQGSEPLPPCQW